MTTKLAGEATRFLPFNLGHDRRSGNPPNPNGHRTSYLWEHVWQRDNWMDLLARFIHVQRPEKAPPPRSAPARWSSSPATTSGTPSWRSKRMPAITALVSST